ncbi:hypothetical protein A4U53_011070 [Rhizobium ruizarguesonis]|uniref:Uncharacterized protein n=1 Tax=Rhizobium ruizarguesonis TaxID=2081791 RepID=A0ACD5EQ66_9HYPH
MMNSISLSLTQPRGSGSAPPSAIYYVDPAGSDANDGLSQATAWQTLAKVNGATIPARAWVLFKGGSTFTGQLTLTAGKHFGTAGNITVFGSYGTGKAIIQAGVNGDCGVYGINPQYVTIRDMDLRGTGTLVSTGSGVYFENTLTGGVYLRGVSVIGNTISGYGLDGISAWGNPADTSGSGFDGMSITDNTVHDCTGNAIQWRGCGITLQSLTTFGLAVVQPTIINAYIARNTVYNCIGKSKAIINSHSGDGILLGQSQDCLIEYNYVHHNGGSGGGLVAIWCYDSQRITVQFNEASFTTVEAGTSDGGGFDVDGGPRTASSSTTTATITLAQASSSMTILAARPSASFPCQGTRSGTTYRRMTVERMVPPRPRGACPSATMTRHGTVRVTPSTTMSSTRL